MRLRTYLLLLALPILIPVIVFSAVALKMLEDAERDSALQGLRESARNFSLLVDRELYSAEASLKVLASSPSLARGDLADFYRQAAAADRGTTAWTILLDENGRQLINREAGFGMALPPADAKERAGKVLQSGHTVVSDVIPDPFAKRLITTVNVPVYAASGKRYVLTMAFSADYFNRLMKEARLPADQLVGLQDSHGNIIACTPNREEPVASSMQRQLIKAEQSLAEGMIRHVGDEGQDLYSAFTHSSLSGWAIAVSAPAREIERSARQAAIVAGLGMLAAILSACGVAFYFGGKLVTLIRQAASTASVIGRGRAEPIVRSKVLEFNELQRALHAADRQLSQAKKYRRRSERERQALLLSEREARKVAENENKAKDQFLAMLGHELRNPLAPIATAAQLLSLPGVDRERLRYASEVIARQTDHITRLVNDLLDVARVTRRAVTLARDHVRIGDIINGAIEQVRPLIDSHKHRLAVQLPGTPAWVIGDRTRLVQVVANILTNSAKYTPDGGNIAIEVQTREEWLSILVEDDGRGIDHGLLPRVFELFSQAERTSGRAQGGLGLGLALVKSLVELHRGTVSAHSDGPDKGSEFTVRLPLASAPPEKAAPPKQKKTKQSRKVRVMLVDDNVDASDSLALYLSAAAGYRVYVHYTGAEALACAGDNRPDVLILDIGLPDMDGHELVARLRAHPVTAKAFMIAQTGYGQAADKKKAVEAGFDVHLAKPASPAAIVELITAWTAKRRKQAQLA